MSHNQFFGSILLSIWVRIQILIKAFSWPKFKKYFFEKNYLLSVSSSVAEP
jgi:hypothetical protein